MVLFGGTAAGYTILAASAVFLINIIYRSIQFHVFDEIVVAMVGVVSVYGLIGVLLIVVFARPRGSVSDEALSGKEEVRTKQRLDGWETARLG
jgi:hypothetical protein